MLSRRIGEEIVIGEQIWVVVATVNGDRVRLGNCAPSTMNVKRHEVYERRLFSPYLQIPGLRGSLPSQEEDLCRS